MATSTPAAPKATTKPTPRPERASERVMRELDEKAKAAATKAERLADQDANGTRTGRGAAKAGSSRKAGTGKPAGPSTKDAAEKVLRAADGPMHVGAIAKKIIDGKLAPGLQGKTPAATIGAQIVTEANRPGGRFVKTDKATFDVRELNPKGAKKRPAAKA